MTPASIEEEQGTRILSAEDLNAKFEELRSRCRAANLQYEDFTFDDINYLTLFLPNGRAKRAISVTEYDAAEELLKHPFEKYVALGEYAAICCYETGFIEASLKGLGVRANLTAIAMRLFRKPLQEIRGSGVTIELRSPQSTTGPVIRLHSKSPRLAALFDRSEYFPAVSIEGLQITTHDEAVSRLETLTEALFFQLDLRFDVGLTLARERTTARVGEGRLREARTRSDETLTFPTSQYDRKPASLYWYGRSANGMPLLQFLAYYQCLEYYFPINAQRDAIRRTRNIIKNPAFNVHDDSDVTRLLSTIQMGRSTVLGDERSQLRATIFECVEAEDLRRFLTSDARRKDFYSSHYKPISEVKLPIASTDADLRGAVADRIYSIRCRIVHTKVASQDGSVELLLPFSREADLLDADIELVQYVARQALISASVPLAM